MKKTDEIEIGEWIVRKLVNANPGCTVSSMQMFFAALFCLLINYKLKTGGQTIYRKPHRKVTKLKSKFYVFLG